MITTISEAKVLIPNAPPGAYIVVYEKDGVQRIGGYCVPPGGDRKESRRNFLKHIDDHEGI